MGSRKHKKKYESESSSSESEASSSSSSESSNEKKYSKKSKHSSSEESYEEKYSEKSKRRRSSDESHSEEDRRPKQRKRHVEDNKHKEKDHHDKDIEKEKEKHRYKSPVRERSRDGKKSKERDVDEHRNRRDYDKDRYDDRDRNRRDYNNKEREDDRYRNKREDYRRDDRKPFRHQGESKEYKDDNYYRNRGRERRSNNRHGNRRRSSSFDHANAKWGKQNDAKTEKKDTQQKEKPNFKLSGKLTEETNTYRGVVIKYSEPPEARKPRRRWRLYPFKGEKALQTLYIHRESAYLIGRERKVVDLPVDHPSCSKQHAALQYRLVPFTREDGSTGKRVRPYIIDLESANGTFINNKKIEPKKYYELFEKDVIKFGYSSREYVLLHENSKDEAMDDDVKQEEETPIKEEAQ